MSSSIAAAFLVAFKNKGGSKTLIKMWKNISPARHFIHKWWQFFNRSRRWPAKIPQMSDLYLHWSFNASWFNSI